MTLFSENMKENVRLLHFKGFTCVLKCLNYKTVGRYRHWQIDILEKCHCKANSLHGNFLNATMRLQKVFKPAVIYRLSGILCNKY